MFVLEKLALDLGFFLVFVLERWVVDSTSGFCKMLTKFVASLFTSRDVYDFMIMMILEETIIN